MTLAQQTKERLGRATMVICLCVLCPLGLAASAFFDDKRLGFTMLGIGIGVPFVLGIYDLIVNGDRT